MSPPQGACHHTDALKEPKLICCPPQALSGGALKLAAGVKEKRENRRRGVRKRDNRRGGGRKREEGVATAAQEATPCLPFSCSHGPWGGTLVSPPNVTQVKS